MQGKGEGERKWVNGREMGKFGLRVCGGYVCRLRRGDEWTGEGI